MSNKTLLAVARQLEEAQAAFYKELDNELRELPSRYGISATEFANRFAQANRLGRGSGRATATPVAKSATPVGAANKRRRKRAVITDETRASVKKMVNAGKTGREIAAALSISLPSVQNIKTQLGMVKKKK